MTLDAIDSAGKHSYFTGCYTLRQVNPGIQAVPPFRPLHIVEGHLKAATASSPAPAKC